MENKILGIHHITALASDPQRNVDFYTRVLGLRLVKKTVNFDAPDVYHLYFGDEVGHPGTILTFFPFPHAARGKHGVGEVAAVAFSAPGESRDYWVQRLARHDISFEGPAERFGEEFLTFQDPDGMMVELVFSDTGSLREAWQDGPIPPEFAVRGLKGTTLWLQKPYATFALVKGTMGFDLTKENGNRFRLAVGSGAAEAAVDVVAHLQMQPARTSAGSVHHIAWRVSDEESQKEWKQIVDGSGVQSTDIIDRRYFRSVYFREPGGVLFELATDKPGFTIDETAEHLGTRLQLPPWLEQHRGRLEQLLPSIKIPKVSAQV